MANRSWDWKSWMTRRCADVRCVSWSNLDLWLAELFNSCNRAGQQQQQSTYYQGQRRSNSVNIYIDAARGDCQLRHGLLCHGQGQAVAAAAAASFLEGRENGLQSKTPGGTAHAVKVIVVKKINEFSIHIKPKQINKLLNAFSIQIDVNANDVQAKSLLEIVWGPFEWDL